jgi:hypothetical protein
MTYRNNSSYVRFPESIKTIPTESIDIASELTDKLNADERAKKHLRDHPSTTPSQNVFHALETED